MENTPMYYEDEISLDELIAPLKKRWKTILLFSTIVAVIAAVYSLFLPRIYEAKSYIKIGTDGGRAFESIGQIKTIMSSHPSLVAIAKELNIKPTRKNIRDLKRKIKYAGKAELLEITVEGLSPESAIKTAEIISNMILKRHEKFYGSAQKNILNALEIIKDYVRPIPISTGTSEFKIIPTEIEIKPHSDGIPVKGNRIQIVIISFIIGAVLSTLYSYWLERKKGYKQNV